ncbi:dTDP-4-dehydrorhamnose 3,5-epimerase family protein [Nocardia alba]|uniref:NDP-hexose 3,5-(Or5-) epimerase n=1 Tax=Nocardia alba TaxID=225051 RepID=A0A4R1F6G4_9NOCA|nr:dTDP-4-dehydrorhamnose 3,5-epimerase [Nocardia alba]TCJ89906.1 NDP-hexose 3,5-(Or5-) epimerase [Nocardia alba]
MRIEETELAGVVRLHPEPIPDRRGRFHEAWRREELERAVAHRFDVRQVNVTTSHKDTLRGIHTTIVPPGMDKLVTCVRGAVLDVAVDLRVGSPTFGKFTVTRQDAASGTGIFMGAGIGHAYTALADDTAMLYLCSQEYVHGTMLDIDALDPEIGIPWNLSRDPIRSDKDAAAPTLREAMTLGILPTWEACVAANLAAAP